MNTYEHLQREHSIDIFTWNILRHNCFMALVVHVSAVAVGPARRCMRAEIHQLLSKSAKKCAQTDRAVTFSCSVACYDRLVVAKFSKSRIWDRVPEDSTFYFWDTQISLQHSVRLRYWSKEASVPKNQLDSSLIPSLNIVSMGGPKKAGPQTHDHNSVRSYRIKKIRWKIPW